MLKISRNIKNKNFQSCLNFSEGKFQQRHFSDANFKLDQHYVNQIQIENFSFPDFFVFGMHTRILRTKYLFQSTTNFNGPLRKISKSDPIFWRGNFGERHSFRRGSGELPKTLWKLCLSPKFLSQEIW